MRRMMKYKWKASYTVEAAFLTGMMLFCIVLVLYTAFYLHDRLTLSLVLRETVRWGVNREEQGIKVTEAELVEEAIRRQGLLLAMGTISYTGYLEDKTIGLSYTASSRLPFPAIGRYLTAKDEEGTSFYIEEELWKPENSIRLIRLLGGVVE